MTPDDLSFELFERRVSLELSERSSQILGYHWELFEPSLDLFELRQERRASQKTTTIDGERVDVDGMSDDEADLAAEEAGEEMREVMIQVIEDEELIATGEFLEDVSSAMVLVEEL